MENKIKVKLFEIRFPKEGGTQRFNIFEGEVDTIQFRNYDERIGTPEHLGVYTDGSIGICFTENSNIIARVDDEGTLWCEAAVTEQSLKELKERRQRAIEAHKEMAEVISDV